MADVPPHIQDPFIGRTSGQGFVCLSELIQLCELVIGRDLLFNSYYE